MNKDWLFSSEEYICDVRTAGVLIQNGKLLVQRDRDGREYALPGGHIQIGEMTQDALVREFREETGAQIVVQDLLWTEESFWEWKGRQCHSFGFYYRIDLAEGAQIPDAGEFVPQKDNCRVVLGWMPIEKIRETVIYPEFLKNAIADLDGSVRHFISKT